MNADKLKPERGDVHQHQIEILKVDKEEEGRTHFGKPGHGCCRCNCRQS